MKNLKYILILILIYGCYENKNNTHDLPSNSIFNLSSEWRNQNNIKLHLKDLKGKTLVVVMIYTSCQSACPILISKMKQIEQKIDRNLIKNINMVLVSIDPETDTPDHLKEFATNNNMDNPQWIFLTSNEIDTREFANVLAMKYKKISPIDFSHSNIITIFNPSGQLVTQEEGLEINSESIAEKVIEVEKLNH